MSRLASSGRAPASSLACVRLPDRVERMTSSAQWRLAAGLLFAIVSVAVLCTFRQYGTVWDEEVQYVYGEYVLRWFSSGFRDRSALTFGDL